MLKIIIIKQNSPRVVACLDGTRCFGLAVECACWWLGEYKLYHSVREPHIMCVSWKISRFLVAMLTMRVYRSKYYSSLFKNRALAPLQIPASLCEGPIYLLLCWVIILLLKSTSWRAPLSYICFVINWYWVWVWMDLFNHELQCLVSPWSLKVLCIYVLRSQKGLARYILLYHIMIVLRKSCHPRFIIIAH